MNEGLIIIYIGDGKGKTTASVGLAVRAAGAGKKVLFCQFVKAAVAKAKSEWPLSSEIAVLKSIPGITVEVLGKGFVGILGDKKAHEEHRQAALEGLNWLRGQIESGAFDLIVADELISAVELDVMTMEEVLAVFKLAREKQIVLAVTGHNKYNVLVEEADLVTDMKMVKHPYYHGRLAEQGIDY